MKYKKGDKFKVTVEVIDIDIYENDEDRPLYRVEVMNRGRLWFTKGDLDSAEKIEPEYEEGAYYWVANERGEDAVPMKYSRNGGFHLFSSMYFNPYYVGDKIPQPKKPL